MVSGQSPCCRQPGSSSVHDHKRVLGTHLPTRESSHWLCVSGFIVCVAESVRKVQISDTTAWICRCTHQATSATMTVR